MVVKSVNLSSGSDCGDSCTWKPNTSTSYDWWLMVNLLSEVFFVFSGGISSSEVVLKCFFMHLPQTSVQLKPHSVRKDPSFFSSFLESCYTLIHDLSSCSSWERLSVVWHLVAVFSITGPVWGLMSNQFEDINKPNSTLVRSTVLCISNHKYHHLL